MASIDIHADVITKYNGCYRFYYLRTTDTVLVYHGRNFDNLTNTDTVEHIRREGFVDFVEDYLTTRGHYAYLHGR